ncbi:hypothetical protein PYW07_007656 [Mythimna separata]|uniref:SCP domain-containing protein n=1 Tax=Mythimna separata TaxID=271217 RepID=A0AAD8DTY1_MYTSE|nr:hypothetical protein PYW07_007656 [Mythimna separata]
MFSEVPLDDSHEAAILHKINSMRAQAAHGTTIGKGQQKLPRAYGLKKVFWDSELAAFAKIMINQCITRHRYSCAASKNFPSPMMVYAFANTSSSATAIIDNIFASWEADALATTPDDILKSPDLKGGDPRPYIKMVVGDVTHVGCAAGIYEHEIKPFAIQANDNIRLSGHIVCYLSHYSRQDTPVYNTTEPIPGTWWTKCGCPPMYRETRDCLCVPIPSSEHMMRQPTAVLFTRESRSTITTSTQAYYNNLENYMQHIYNIELPKLTGPVENPQLLDLPTEKQLELTPQQNLEWSPKETLDPQMRQRLEPVIQQTLMETQAAANLRAGVETPTPTCTTAGRCEPKIVMLPIFTIQNAPQHIGRKNRRGYYSRSANTSSVDDSFSDENYDELPQNTSIRSIVLETVNKIRQKQADIYSNENTQHGEPIEHSQITVDITKRTVEDITSTVEPSQPTTNKLSPNDAKKTVMNLLELIEEHEKIEDPAQNEADPNQQINARENPNDKAKKRVMHLLDLLEEKGGNAQLNSREIVEFDAKMRKIYTSVLGDTRKGDFIKMWDMIS